MRMENSRDKGLPGPQSSVVSVAVIHGPMGSGFCGEATGQREAAGRGCPVSTWPGGLEFTCCLWIVECRLMLGDDVRVSQGLLIPRYSTVWCSGLVQTPRMFLFSVSECWVSFAPFLWSCQELPLLFHRSLPLPSDSFPGSGSAQGRLGWSPEQPGLAGLVLSGTPGKTQAGGVRAGITPSQSC